VLAALKRAPDADPFDADRFEAWCQLLAEGDHFNRTCHPDGRLKAPAERDK